MRQIIRYSMRFIGSFRREKSGGGETVDEDRSEDEENGITPERGGESCLSYFIFQSPWSVSSFCVSALTDIKRHA
jgi:hypothetical protein